MFQTFRGKFYTLLRKPCIYILSIFPIHVATPTSRKSVGTPFFPIKVWDKVWEYDFEGVIL